MKKYDDNIPLLKNRVETHAFIRNISKHRLPDGTLDVEGNLKLWNDGMQGFVKTPLWEKTPGWREDTHLQGEPYLVFVPGNPGSPTILIAHGGGFSWRTGCEGPNVAWYFHQAGYNTAILSYRLLPYDRYASMADMQRAIRLLRARKEEFGIGEKIVVMGFSAGGMICGNCATHFDNGSIDLAVLDIMLPKMSGVTILHEIRKISNIPVVMLTAVDDEYTQSNSFDELADDYITKPFSMLILGKRITALLRRSENKSTVSTIRLGNVTVDFAGYTAHDENGKIDITPKELEILKVLIENKGLVLSRNQILDDVWGYDCDVIDRTIDA